MYKRVVDNGDGTYKETDFFETFMYAQKYAEFSGKKLVGSTCTLHDECGSRCCVGTPSKLCHVIDQQRNPLTSECDEYLNSEINHNIMISVIISVGIVVGLVCLLGSGKIYQRFFTKKDPSLKYKVEDGKGAPSSDTLMNSNLNSGSDSKDEKNTIEMRRRN